jgi:hypothetical protein
MTRCPRTTGTTPCPMRQMCANLKMEKLMGEVSSIDYHQKRGMAMDIIDEAIATYASYMLDDDYDAQGCLDKIIKRMRERRELLGKR